MIEIPEEGLVVLKFGADWCPPCKRLKPIIKELDFENKDVTFLDVDVDEYPDLASKYSVRGVPSVFLFRDGEELSKFVGFKTKEEFQEHINLLSE